MADTKLEHVRAQMAAFKEGLEGFALKHRRASLLHLPYSQSRQYGFERSADS